MSGETSSSGRAWARAGFVFGAAGSLGGNVQAAWLPYGTTDALAGHPTYARQVAAMVWPAVLIVTIEVMARIEWPSARHWRNVGWTAARFGALASIAGSSAVISYGHVHKVLDAWGYGTAAAAGAVCLDGVMVFCGFAMLAANRTDSAALGVGASDRAAETRPGATRLDGPNSVVSIKADPAPMSDVAGSDTMAGVAAPVAPAGREGSDGALTPPAPDHVDQGHGVTVTRSTVDLTRGHGQGHDPLTLPAAVNPSEGHDPGHGVTAGGHVDQGQQGHDLGHDPVTPPVTVDHPEGHDPNHRVTTPGHVDQGHEGHTGGHGLGHDVDLTQLSDKDQVQAIVDHGLLTLTQADMAHRLGVSLTTAKRRIRAAKRLASDRQNLRVVR